MNIGQRPLSTAIGRQGEWIDAGVEKGRRGRCSREGHDVAFTHCNAPAEAKAMVAELASPSPGARCAAYRLDIRGSFQCTRLGASIADTLNCPDATPHNAGVNRRDMAAHMNEKGGAFAG